MNCLEDPTYSCMEQVLYQQLYSNEQRWFPVHWLSRQPFRNVTAFVIRIPEDEKYADDILAEPARCPTCICAKNVSTIAKEEAREFVRTYITDRLQPLLDAQLDN